MIGYFKKKKPLDIEFIDVSRRAYSYNPVMLAKDCPTHFLDDQKNKYGAAKFYSCPGMADYKNYGYIIPAWDDIHILANHSGVLATVGGGSASRPTPFPQAGKMDTQIGDGIFKPTGIPYEVLHIGSPWRIILRDKTISAFVLPAFFHSNFLDDIYVYPGIVDYKNFSSLNLICSPKRPCNITIRAGQPLLHVMPFVPGTITGGYGPATHEQEDQAESFVSTAKQFYRKYIMQDKNTTLNKLDKEELEE